MPADADVAREQGSSALHDVDVHYAGAQVQQCDYLSWRRFVVVFVTVLQGEGIDVHNSRSSPSHREYIGVVENLVLLDGHEQNVHMWTAEVFGQNLIVEIYIGKIKWNVLCGFLLNGFSELLIAHGRQRNLLHDYRMSAYGG